MNGNTNGINTALNKKTPTTPTPKTANETLYSTVNKSKLQKQLEDDLVNEINQNSPQQQHLPIYDSTTNIQHQRVIQNLNRFNQQVNTNQQQQLITNRSKTPGPDVIYFRNNNNEMNQHQNGYATKSATMSSGQLMNQYQPNRSKTPTADMMYYPSMSNSNMLIKRGGTQAPQNELVYNDESPSENHQIISDVDGNNYIEMVIDLYKQETGFGFRIIGGEEEGSQVAIGFIVQGGAAHVDARLRPNDEIIMIDNECVLGATHRRVVQLMAIAGLNRKVKIMIRRRISPVVASNLIQQQQQQKMMSLSRPASRQQQQVYPYTITLFRNGNEGFGFVIISTINKTGPSIGNFFLFF